MNDAYRCEKLRSYSIQVESIAVYDNYLVVGNRQGIVLWYKTCPKMNLLYCDKKLCGKPIIQLAAVAHLRIVICLSGERGVSVLELVESQNESVHHYNVTDMLNTKSASCFTVDVKTLPFGALSDFNCSTAAEVRLCVANKKELQMYYWNGKSFSEQFPRIRIRLDVPRTLLWCDQLIVIGCKNEYYLVDVNTKELNPFVLTGKCLEPIIVKISDTAFGVVKDSQLIVTSTTKNADEGQIIRLDGTPFSILYDAPYLIVSTGYQVHVRTVKTFDGHPVVRQVVQLSTDSKITKMFSCKRGLVYASSAVDIWRLTAVPFKKQIKRLCEERHFRLALRLVHVSDESIVDDKDKYETRIRKLYAESLFKQKKYNESMKEFLKLNIDPFKVIRIFPDLLPQCGSADDDNKTIADEDTTLKVVALIDYLTEVRRKVSDRSDDDRNEKSHHREQLFQIIDTTLLKCYLQTNDAMIAPLVRLNKCHFLESETTLKKYKKYNELVILYRVKGLHRKALEFLRQQSDDLESSLRGPSKTIEYLQHIDAEHIDLIFEFSDWVLSKYPDEGLGIFTEDVGNVEQLPRSKILEFLRKNHNRLVVPYLESAIRAWNCSNTAFHDYLIVRYKELIEKHDGKTAAEADGQIAADTRRKLLTFLKQSDHYSLEKMLVLFPIRDECFEERVIILEKLGRHEQALSVYVYKLNDVDRAIEYCDKVCALGNENSDQIYVTLLKMLNDPTDSWLATLKDTPEPIQNFEKTIEILNKYATLIPPMDVLDNLSDGIPVHRVTSFLVTALETMISGRRLNQLLREKISYESQKVTVAKCHKCSLCQKQFGPNSAFVRYPNGEIVHLSCHRNL